MQASAEKPEVCLDSAQLDGRDVSGRGGISDFAGVLSALTLPAPGLEHSELNGDDGAEGDPTLSYECALRSHARYAPAGTPQTQSWNPACEGQNRRSASVTVRLSEAENTQLKNRAAEAGLTVSAYLRSCTFEVEALRTKVKQVLGELRAGNEGPGDQGNGGPREQGNEGTGRIIGKSAGGSGSEPGADKRKRRSTEEMRHTRVLAHIGGLWIGLSSSRPS